MLFHKKLYRVLFLFFPLFYFCQEETYFQQEVNYKIDVRLDDKCHVLRASEKIEYINNSSESLSFLYFHLWPNAYKNNATALAKQILENGKTEMYFGRKNEFGWIDSLDFKVNGEKIKMEYDVKDSDICKLILNTPLKPGEKIEITTPFRVQLPSATISRLGHIGQAYAISQWFPKPAVYDKNGWNQMPYLDQGEFYSEFGSFDVSITLPKNYVVGATGDLENGETELEWLDKKILQTESKIVKRRQLAAAGIQFFDSLAFPISSTEFKTLRYKQNNVHDFAWFADKRFNVMKGEVILPKSKRKVTAWAMFTDSNFELWLKATEYIADATFFYSLWNGDYQYNNVTAVDGTISAGGGMEYPNITIISEVSNAFELETVIMHEVGHNWFYGMLGSNERIHAWMDEGINSFNELRYNRTKYPGATVGELLGRDSTTKLLGINQFKNAYQYYFLYEKSALENKDQPDELHSALFSEGNYGAIVYSKTALAFDYLFHYMGEDKFDEAMKFYFEHYHFKHPYPADLRKTLEFYSGKDLSWFFDDMLGTTKKLDYRVLKYREEDNGSHSVLVKNSGEISGPVLLCGMKNGKLKGMVWYDGFTGERWLGFPTSEIDLFVIDKLMIMPEVQRQNNRIRTKGLFKKIEPIQIRLLAMMDNPSKTQLWVTPFAAVNPYNGVMVGLHLHNNFLFEKKFQFDFAPAYSLNNKQIAGLANIQFNFHPQKNFQTVQAGIDLKRFAYSEKPFDLNYNRIDNYFLVELKKKKVRSPLSNKFGLHYLTLVKENYGGDYTVTPPWLIKYFETKTFAELSFIHENKRTISPYSLKINVQAGDMIHTGSFGTGTFSKASAEFNYHYTMNKKNNGFDIRIFAGTFLSTGGGTDVRFRMGGISGYQDYTYQYLYLGRTETQGLSAQQFVEADGAFKTRTYLGQSSKYLLAVNIKTPKLLKMFGLFADIGTCGSDGLLNKGDKVMYDAGIHIQLLKDIADIYIPLACSKDIQAGLDANPWNFFERIKFNFRIDKMNPKKYLDKIISF
ncbi:MAG: M1 family metallopeptidase [Bacteroidia bacterium]|nr:M1 family metallopeptidase [Bacteroidia bacterium]